MTTVYQSAKRSSRDDGWGRSTRFYDIPDGRSVPSVTSILSIVAKPALVNWAARVEREMCIEAAANLYTDTIGGANIIKLSRPTYITSLEARIGKQKAASKLLQKANDIGTAVHALIEWNLRKEFGQKVGPSPKLPDGAEQAFAAYQHWRQTVRLTPLAIEQTVWSATYGYGGTMDLYAELTIDGKPCRAILDWKTGKAIYGESSLQSVAYIQALVEMGHATSPVHGLVVRFPKTATEAPFEVKVIYPESQLRLFDAFLAAKRLWEWNESLSATSVNAGNGTAMTSGLNRSASGLVPSPPLLPPTPPNNPTPPSGGLYSSNVSTVSTVSTVSDTGSVSAVSAVSVPTTTEGPIAADKLVPPKKRNAKKAAPEPAAVTDAPDIVRDYNSALGAHLSVTAGNLAAVMRAKGQGYTREQMARVFAAVRDKSTETAAWCAANNHSFEYLIRPTFRHYRTAEQTPGPLDKILNELDGAKPAVVSGPERPIPSVDESAKQRALWEAGRELFKRETGL
jgi:hypothetical protein